MTRTPPDMETEMSKAKGVVHLGTGHTKSFYRMPDGTEYDLEAVKECFEALLPFGPPVVVAEALPELVDAAKEYREYVKVSSTVAASKAHEITSRFDAALAKLKARP